MHNRILLLLILLISGLFISATDAAESSTFTLVIDPGHGGMDPGTLGSIVKEKDVVLAVGLKLGELIHQYHPDVKVIYTRNTDVFIPLNQRAIIANKAKANLFISIHADHAETPTVNGASTFTLGQNRTRENFEIAKRENSVILLEEDYQQRYEGFDPNSAESYIMFEFMQDNYMNQSIQFASILQGKFTASGRYDRGVRQDVFLVLRCTSMPSVLVEIGFLSNKEEERFLKSEEGRDQMARSLLKGFTDFKNDYERKSTGKQSASKKNTTNEIPVENKTFQGNSPNEKTALEIILKSQILAKKRSETKQDEVATSDASESEIIFKIQMLTSSFKLSENDRKLKGLKMDYYFEKNLYKYTYGIFSQFEEANNERKILATSFKDAFIVAFKNGQKITIEEAKSQIKD